MKSKIQSVLIANRSEIAIRIIRACREMGIRTVAVYSDADQTALHPQMADAAFNIGPAPSSQSYLRQDVIIETAIRAKCDAIHPGYGFLSENADFAERVENAGLIFIGPPSDAIRAMGDKTSARKLMQTHGVPTVPGTEEAIRVPEESVEVCEKIGYPVLIKAAAGGGGKGMRIVQKREDLFSAITSSQNEARSAFGDDRVYIEKYLEKPRHIEFQIVADAHGNIVHLGERECSIQRRHQKVIEESPSAIMTKEMREKIGASAITAARVSGYRNAGTVEFLVDKHLNYYFLEMNTRLQVEHPVTEMVTGIDLVKTQIRIAQGEALQFTQEQIVQRGHAIECRLCAEDARNNFLPSIGKIEYYKPSQGFGVREDSGIEQGTEIQVHYDPMFAKLIAWAGTREEAIERMKRALKEYRIVGIDTTIPFCQYVLHHPKFIAGDFDTHFVQQHFEPSRLFDESIEQEQVAILAAILSNERRNGSTNGAAVRTATNASGWKAKRRTEQLR